MRRNPELPDIPTLQDLAKNDLDRDVLTFISADTAISRPLVTNAGVPRERVEALRRAFDQAMRDPEFLAEATRLNLDVDPISAEQVTALVRKAYTMPGDVVARTKAVLEAGAAAQK